MRMYVNQPRRGLCAVATRSRMICLLVGFYVHSTWGALTVALVCAGCGRRDQAVGVRSYVPGHGELFGF